MKKKEPTPGTVLIVNAIHDPQKRVYTYDTREVSEETAREQLSKPNEMDRNIHWRGVRYATEEEYAEFYGLNKGEASETTEDKPKRTRKVKEEVTNE